jgi:hypothetical protein
MKKDRNRKFQNRTIRPIKQTDCDDEDVDAAKFFQAWELAIMRDQ